MSKRFIPFFLFLFFVCALGAQRPVFVPVDIRETPDASRAACDNKAGTSKQNLTNGSQSNDKKFLCYKDRLTIKHDNNQILSSDPVKTTPAGVGYLLLTCPPTKTGPTIQDVAADACVLKTPTGTAPKNGFYVSTSGNTQGDGEFINDNYWQNTYGGGKPYRLYFAPITFDQLDNTSSVTYEGTPSGACVDVNTADAFDVVYLNEIKGAIISQGNLAGSFKVTGGLSEYDNVSNYSISIALKTDLAKKGVVTSGSAKHNSTVNFTVPENGTYIVTIEDGKSCGTQFEILASSVVDVLIQNDTICANSQGELFIVPSGGTPPYTYTCEKAPAPNPLKGPFPLPINGASIIGLDGGEYLITVKDANGVFSETRTGSVLKANQILAVTMSQNSPDCSYSLNGTVTANVIGGFKPYYYIWSTTDQGANKESIVGLPKGKYCVTVLDNIGCLSDACTNLTGVEPMKRSNDKSVGATCYGAKDGLVNFEMTGGTPDPITKNYEKFSFSWNNGKNTFSYEKKTGGIFQDVDPGKYKVTVTDTKGCIYVDSIIIPAKRELEVNKTVSDVKCFGGKDGVATILVTQKGQGSNSTSQMNFTWNPTSPTILNTAFTSTNSGLGVGKYMITVTDAFKCIKYDSVQVKQPTSALDAVISIKKDPTCVGNSIDGHIKITPNGGTAPYGYKWNKGGSGSEALNLVAGTYTITVTDANDCTKEVTATLNDPPGPKVTAIAVKNVNCFTDSNGSISITATPANAADVLTYKWSNGTNGVNVNELLNLKPDAYSVTITDNKGCAIIRDTVVKSPPALELVGLPAITKPSCPGTADGQVEITIKGGTSQYSYNWTNQTTSGSGKEFDGPIILIKDLKIGVYDITITDQNNCPGLVISLVDVSLPPTISISKVVDKIVDCYENTCNAKATVTVLSGNSPTGDYTFTWESGSIGIGKVNTPVSASDLCKGYASVTISDGRCDLVDSVFIDAPTKVTYDTMSLVVTPVNCFNESNGAISLLGKGGEGPYTYKWLGSNTTTPSITGLPKGEQILEIRDSKNCEFRTTITVSEPPQLVASVVRVDSLKCFNTKDGRIELSASGGNDAVAGQPKYTFAWPFNVSTSSVGDKLTAGNYSITITDSKGCSTTKDTTVGAPKPIEFMLDTIAAPLCNGYTTEIKLKSATGGNGSQLSNYALVVDDQELPRGVSAQVNGGKHRVNVADPEGCVAEKDLEVTIQEPPRIRVYLGQDVELELGDSYEINAVIESVVPVAKYNWTTSVGATPLTFSDSCKNRCGLLIRPLVDGSYILQVEDSVGCIGADTLNLTIDRNRNVFIPNIFSPNVDGTNDFFEVFADPQSVEKINYLKVFDRWGTQVFESPTFAPQESRVNGNRWNGYYKDNEANIGVYVYVCEVKFVDGVVIVFRGDVMLAR